MTLVHVQYVIDTVREPVDVTVLLPTGCKAFWPSRVKRLTVIGFYLLLHLCNEAHIKGGQQLNRSKSVMSDQCGGLAILKLKVWEQKVFEALPQYLIS